MSQGQVAQETSRNALIALGSNVTKAQVSPVKRVNAAIASVGARLKGEFSQSRLFQTPSFPAGSGPDFVNAVIRVETTLSAAAILAVLHEIEAENDRTREQRWEPRTLDLDLLALGDEIHPDQAGFEHWHGLTLDQQQQHAPQQLVLPHPRLQDRAFVLVPMSEVAPDWIHPVLGRSVIQMRDALPAGERAEITVLSQG